MKLRSGLGVVFALVSMMICGTLARAQQPVAGNAGSRPKGPCDIYAAAGDPCVAAHSTTRALYASYNGPLYQILRQSDGKTLDIGVVPPSTFDGGGYANATAQDAFCAHTYCWIAKIYDQSPKHNDLIQPPRGGFSGPALGGFNNLPLADMAPISVMGHKVYGVFIAPGMGLRQNDAKGTAVDDQAEGQYWVINGHHYNSGCCFDYGNAEIDSRDDGNGTMETTYYGDTTPWYHGNPPGPWIMTDQENNLVGCVNSDGSKLCPHLPNITWRFVTAMAKGEPHHWTSLGGDAQRGSLSVMFDGPRIDFSYDPMRKQGAILLGNGGDNSNGSQGTFYEGAMTAAGTFPSDATDQLIQANVVGARYAEYALRLTPASQKDMPPGLQTFYPDSSQESVVTFTNTSDSLVRNVRLSIAVPTRQWTAVVAGGTEGAKTFAEPLEPGASVSATFKITSGSEPINGDLVANASWTEGKTERSGSVAEKVRNVSPVKLNEFRVGTTSPTNSTNSFIELYNAGTREVDISNWTLVQHAAQQAVFSTVRIPRGKKLAAGGFYLLGLSNSGLAVPAHSGDDTIYLRNVTDMKAGDTISINTEAGAETHTIRQVGTAAGSRTTLWQPVPQPVLEGSVLTIPVGSTNVPVTSTEGFAVGEKMALGYGATYPVVGRDMERYEVVTVTAIGKPGTQAFLAADAPIGSTNIKVTSVANISVGDKIRLDIDSVGHGAETVTVANVGTQAYRTTLVAKANVGATNIKVRTVNGFSVGDKVVMGTPANQKIYAITAIGTAGPTGSGIDFTPAFAEEHSGGEDVVNPGTGLDLGAPLKFKHAANLPFSARGTGISFQPATAYIHSSNEPIQPLGTGITLDRPLAKEHPIDTVVRDAAVTTAGYQGTAAPNYWFGGPALSPSAGSILLRDAAGMIVDSLNYGLIVDPWIAEGYHAVSGAGHSGCRVTAPGLAGGLGVSAGRFPDGADTDSNCTDFVSDPATTLAMTSEAGAINIKVTAVVGFTAGQPIQIDTGAKSETAVVAKVGTAGATTVAKAIQAGATVIPVASTMGFSNGQEISIGSGSDTETATITSTNRFSGTIAISKAVSLMHKAGTQVAGTGLTLTSALRQPHDSLTSVAGNPATPGSSNLYTHKSH